MKPKLTLEEDVIDFCNAIEAAAVNLKQRIVERHGITNEESPAVSEDNFNLNSSEFTSQKLGLYGVTEEKGNIPEKWTRAYNILKQTNATISSRYHGKDYGFSYWLYNDKIYRQKLKK